MPSFGTRSFYCLFSALFLQPHLARGFSQCYYPDGSVPKDYIWEPCVGTGSGAYSSCCVPSEGDICQPNGLCYYPNYSDGGGTLYRGTCTDRTWNDPSCNANICVSGFETTWMWVAKCDVGSTETTVCGTLSDGVHSAVTCASGATTNTASFLTTRTTTSARRYTAPPSVDPSLYSVFTSTYTTQLTATVQTTTLTSTFQSTFTSAIGKAVVSATSSVSSSGSVASAETTTTAAGSKSKAQKAVTLSTGILVIIIVGPLLAIAISLGIFLVLRRKRVARQGDSIRLNSAGNHPPPNGPVGADQVHPYEVDVNEASGPRKEFYAYKSPKIDSHEIDDRTATLRGEKAQQGLGEKMPQATELGVQDHERVWSPAPTYREFAMPVELDGTSSVDLPRRG